VSIKPVTDNFRAVAAHPAGKIVVEVAKMQAKSRPEATDLYIDYKVELPDGVTGTIEIMGYEISLKSGVNEATYIWEGY
jgi:hypothetical protein